MHGLIIFDFDGTLYRGDAPYFYYARAIARHLAEDDRTRYLQQVDAHLSGTPGVVAGDNWEAVVRLALPFINDTAVWQSAFLETRAFMLDPVQCPLEVPDGLVTFLRTVRGTVDLVLATNSPAEACFPLLERLHLRDAFDIVVPSAGKPQGLESIAHARWHGAPLPHRTLSIGDHYDNDIAPAWALGWSTVHISPHGYFPGPSTVRGRTLEDVLPFVWQWVESLAKDDDDGNS